MAETALRNAIVHGISNEFESNRIRFYPQSLEIIKCRIKRMFLIVI